MPLSLAIWKDDTLVCCKIEKKECASLGLNYSTPVFNTYMGAAQALRHYKITNSPDNFSSYGPEYRSPRIWL